MIVKAIDKLISALTALRNRLQPPATQRGGLGGSGEE